MMRNLAGNPVKMLDRCCFEMELFYNNVERMSKEAIIYLIPINSRNLEVIDFQSESEGQVWE
jgi:hypothetical protein